MTGGGFRYLHVYCALRLLDSPTPRIPYPAVTAMPTPWKEATQDHWEKSWLDCSDHDMRQWMRDEVEAHDYRPPELELKKKADAGPNARPRHKCSIAPGLAVALDFAIQKHDDLGSVVRDVPFRHEYFQSNGFVQEKGRSLPQDEADRMAPRLSPPVPLGTEIEEIRLLSNSTFLNDSTEPAHAHWKHDNATQASICSAVPLGSCRFRGYDITLAYSTCVELCEVRQELVPC